MTSLQDIYSLLIEAQAKMDSAQQHFQEAKDLLTVAKMNLLQHLPVVAPTQYTEAELMAKSVDELEEIIQGMGLPIPAPPTDPAFEKTALINIILQQ